ncbi:UPF0696 protein C11orf68 homolog [Saccostrea echinata]|uniref:UPF0696 protein C11orf68 homolog n=1 Tax=Saccostrea echinata TaxID=191078 RepID=UPI002A8237AF|nr:UPF0696 protein C11orf68 homolog [Saccostrea echinata]
MEEDMECETTGIHPHRVKAEKPIYDSEYYAAEALACDMDIPVIYSTGRNKEPIEEWLEKTKPSIIHRDDGYGWIHVIRSEDRRNRNDSDEIDVLGLQEAWENLEASEREICKDKIFELANNFRVTAGKWMFWVSTGGKGDYLWSLVAKGIVSGNTLAKQAKISASEMGKEGPDANEHVVCIYNDDFLDKDQVYESERTIRSLGIKCQLHYKPDVFTLLGVYRKNPWNLRPTIYTSNFDVIRNQSIIEEVG